MAAGCKIVLKKCGFVTDRFDGCMYGLTASMGGSSTAEERQLVKKPWKVACLRSTLPNVLNKCCDKTHFHTPCAGRITRSTQSYTPLICDIVHDVCRSDMNQVESVVCVSVVCTSADFNSDCRCTHRYAAQRHKTGANRKAQAAIMDRGVASGGPSAAPVDWGGPPPPVEAQEADARKKTDLLG